MNTVITYCRYGGPDVLLRQRGGDPAAGPGQVRIRVRAVAVNLIDAKVRSGRLDGVSPPSSPSCPAGTWRAWWTRRARARARRSATRSSASPRRRATASTPCSTGRCPSQRRCPSRSAAAVVTVGEAAFRVLKHLGLKAGQTLLILGAGGSVGTIAAQLAVARGITVIGTAAERDLERAGRARRNRGPLRRRLGRAGPRGRAGRGGRGVRRRRGRPARRRHRPGRGRRRGSSPSPTRAPPSTACASPARTRPTGRPRRCPSWPQLLADGRLTLPVWRAYPLARGGCGRTPTWTPAATTARSSCSREEEAE